MSETSLVRRGAVVLDCPDPQALAAFYARLLGWPPAGSIYDNTWARLVDPDGGMGIEFQPSADYRPPTWPDPNRPQMYHFDFRVDDMAAAAAHAVAVGARPLDLSDSHPDFQVYADPDGHPFCLCAC
jgi:catechol 2,3-dioxygenase-like lactoylglutathione lyase family enzyme